MSVSDGAEPFPLPAHEPPHEDGDETVPAFSQDGSAAGRWQELIGEDERRVLLRDIARVALAIGQDLFGEAGAPLADLDIAPSAGDVTGEDPCPRERLAFLQQAWPSLASALSRIEAAPAARAAAQTRLVPVERARRVEPPAVLRALRAAGGRPPDAASTVKHVAETITVLVADTPPNKAVAACLTIWSRDLEAIAALANPLDARDVGHAAMHLRLRVRRHLRREPWQSLLPASGKVADLSVLAVLQSPATPALYRFVGDTFLRYRRAFAFCWNNPLFTLPARESWLLYEYWTIFKAAAALRELGLRAVSADGWALNRAGLTFALAKVKTSRLRFARPGGNGPTVSLGYNILFPTGATNANGYHARSHAMRPDLILQRDDDGRLLVFDAKFKAYAEAGRTLADERANLPLVLDINQAHAYRDALRRGPRRVVHAAWLLYVGRRDRPNLPVIAYPPAAPERPYGDGEVGALLLRPGGIGSEHLRAVIATFLFPAG